jgi:hypothetical protein
MIERPIKFYPPNSDYRTRICRLPITDKNKDANPLWRFTYWSDSYIQKLRCDLGHKKILIDDFSVFECDW